MDISLPAAAGEERDEESLTEAHLIDHITNYSIDALVLRSEHTASARIEG